MQWASKRRFAIIGSGCLVTGLLVLSIGTFIASYTYTPYYMLAFIMMTISMVLLSTGIVVLVVGSRRASCTSK